MAGDGYHGVIWIPAHTDRYKVHDSRQIDAIVLHITEGGTADAQVTARNAFGIPKYKKPNGQWNVASCHYIVGRDGQIVQCVHHKDEAYHAGPENSYTIGIEHNVRANQDNALTGIQYWKSAELVTWLGETLGLPVADRWYLQGHSEIDHTTTHRNCPQRALNWANYMTALENVKRSRAGITPMTLYGSDPMP
jgi:N-acetyl-anhydromuramyl-L-alanine amidase AmpD